MVSKLFVTVMLLSQLYAGEIKQFGEQFSLKDTTTLTTILNSPEDFLDKKDLKIEVEDGKLTISGDKHGTFDVKDAKVIRRELKQSSFKRQFELGDLLDGDKIKANFNFLLVNSYY